MDEFVKKHSANNNTENETAQENSALAEFQANIDALTNPTCESAPTESAPTESASALIDPIQATLECFPQLDIDTLHLVLETYEGFMKERRAQEKSLPRFSLLEECIRIMKEKYASANLVKRTIGWSTAELTDLLRNDPAASQLPCFNGTGLTKDGKEKAKTPSASLYSCLLRELEKDEPRVKRVSEEYAKGHWTLADAE